MSLRPNERTEVRRNRYKVAIDAEEGRRRREDNLVEIRKNQREENLQKKRREGMQTLQLHTLAQAAAIEKKVRRIWRFMDFDQGFRIFDIAVELWWGF